jgi:enamine deaminase RidA (YjgF/YER057c/UK114 family)
MRRNVSSGGPFEDVYGYSRAVRVADQVHVAGTTAQPPHLEGADAYQQAVAALAILEKVFGKVRPAATLVEVSRLLDPRMQVEIEVYAVEPN